MSLTGKMTTAEKKQQKEDAKKIAAIRIGEKRLCGLRDGNKVRFFVAEDLRGGRVAGDMIVEDVTGVIARVTGRTRNNDGWIVRVNCGGGPIQHVVEEYYLAMGVKEPKPFFTI